MGRLFYHLEIIKKLSKISNWLEKSLPPKEGTSYSDFKSGIYVEMVGLTNSA